MSRANGLGIIPTPQAPRTLRNGTQQHDRRARALRRDQCARSKALGRPARPIGRDRYVRPGFHLARERQERALGASPRRPTNRSVAHRLGGTRRDLAIAVLTDEDHDPEVAEVPHVAEQLAVPEAEDDWAIVLSDDVERALVRAARDIARSLVQLANPPRAREHAHAHAR